MINASADFINNLKNGVPVQNYADVTLSNGMELELAPSDFMVGGFKLNDSTANGNKFGIGLAVGKTCSVNLANYNDNLSGYDFYGSTWTLYVGMTIGDTIEKIRKGKFYVISPATPGNTIAITLVDDMYKFDMPYEATTAFPATLHQILSDCCTDCGVTVGFGQFNNYDFTVQSKPTDCTYREVVSWVAQIAGCNARIDASGALDLVWYDFSTYTESTLHGGQFDGTTPYGTGDIADGGNFTDYTSGDSYDGGLFTDQYIVIKNTKTVTVNTDNVTITGVRVIFDDVEELQGTNAYVIEVKDNPLTGGQEEEVAIGLYTRLGGVTFRPFTAKVTCNPLYEPLDVCKVVDAKNNIYTSLINDVEFTICGYTVLSCKADSPIRKCSIYSSEAAKAVVQARRNTKKQITAYSQIVDQMNNLAMNAMGYYKTQELQEDGSSITYLHDKSSLADSLIIYKMTSDGFFVSQDSGESYTAGFDANGNAVVNILSAIGIVCDWIKGGILTLGGENNTNGVINVLDSLGVLKGQWTKNGIEMSQDDGSILKMTPSDGFYRMVGTTKNVYNSLYYSTEVTIYGIGNASITLPSEFNGKDVKVIASLKSIDVSDFGDTASVIEMSCSATYHSDDNTVGVSGIGLGKYMNLSSEYIQYVSSISSNTRSFLTSATLNSYSNTLTTYSASGLTGVTSNIGNKQFVKGDAVGHIGNAEIVISIIAIA